jgi:hypothetical protein
MNNWNNMDFYDKLLYLWNKIELYNELENREKRDFYKWFLYKFLDVECNCYIK